MYFKLSEFSIASLQDQDESGMDFYIFDPDSYKIEIDDIFEGGKQNTKLLYARSSGKAALVKYISKTIVDFSFLRDSLLDVNPISISLTKMAKSISFANSASLPTGYTSTTGAHNLLGSHKYIYPVKLHRFTSTSSDGRFDGKNLTAGTYLTSDADQRFVNTGFGAVGRFALPIPVPASYHHVYIIPAGTTVKVGTVAPNFGQSGGGVEVLVSNNVAVQHLGTTQMDDF